jgi:hypothetical protein
MNSVTIWCFQYQSQLLSHGPICFEIAGFQFHHDWHFMRDMLVHKNSTPYLFHMNWNLDATTKIRFIQQMGDWFLDKEVQSTCFRYQDHTIAATHGLTFDADKYSAHHTDRCCLTIPYQQCHYSDKPSVIPCGGSPVLDDATNFSFW